MRHPTHHHPPSFLAAARLLVSGVLAAAALLVGGWQPASAQTAPGATPSGPDSVTLLQVATAPAPASSAPGTIHFDITVSYHLQSLPSAFLLPFVFEDNADTSTQQNPQGVVVNAGDGQLHLTVDYLPRGGVQTLSLLVGLFRDQNTLLTWAATRATAVNAWAARNAFEIAMADQQAGNLADADTQLSNAIQLEPGVENFYYWRADVRVAAGRYSDAVDDYTTALSLAPGDRAALVGRGIAELWNSDTSSALTDLNNVISTNGTDSWAAEAFRARGLAETALGQTESARSDFQAYLSLTPDAPDQAEVQGWIDNLG